jgi:hypothetical protein
MNVDVTSMNPDNMSYEVNHLKNYLAINIIRIKNRKSIERTFEIINRHFRTY